jgi:hypothetical protein
MPNDKLDELLRRHAEANDITTPGTVENTPQVNDFKETPVEPTPQPTPSISTDPQVDEIDDDDTDYDPYIDYGDDDQEAELKAEEEAIMSEREKLYKEAAKNKIPDAFQPPDEKDMNYNAEAIGFQSEKLAVVAQMVNRVVAKYHIISGEIPPVRELDNGMVVQKMHIMGELIDIYHNSGEKITPEFESLILNNWVLPNGKTAREELDEKGSIGDVAPANNNTTQNPVVAEAPDVAAEININVEPNTPVTLNIDESLTANINKSREINVNVKEISSEELSKRVIVNNSIEQGVIKPYDSGINDQPLTLPRSAYRCTVSAINWFDFIKLTMAAPTASMGDEELRKWSIIYKHIKNVSIGEFADFADFLQKTKFGDRELLMWALLVATANPEETIPLRCGNPDCKKVTTVKYMPSKLIHFNEDALPKHYKDVAEAVGEQAVQLFKEKSDTHVLYTLPTTGITVELREPSVWEQIYEKIPQMNDLYKRYKPSGDMTADMKQHAAETGEAGFDDDMAEFQVMLSMMLTISAVIIHKDGTDYRYDKWDRIEEIITTSLDTIDSGVLIKLAQVVSEKSNCFSFYIEDFVCPHCGRREPRVPITDISNTLLSQLSRRLTNIEINLNETGLS